jgi:hypothetical protein
VTNDNTRAEIEHADIRAFVKYANEAAVGLSTTTLKGLLVINGGAAVALLGFAASASSQSGATQLSFLSLASSLRWFALGVASSVLASGIAYVVMYLQAALVQSYELYHEEPFVQSGKNSARLRITTNTAHILAVVVSISSLLCFLLGTHAVSTAISRMPY